MGHKSEQQSSLLLLFLSSIQFCSQIARAYTIYIVGGNAGWRIQSSANSNDALNYTAWAANITFSLGDSLAFRYDPSHTVVQTHNLTTFQACDASAEDDTIQIWSSSGSTDSTVQLTRTGDTFFFCSADDGAHCRDSGMKFAIKVSFGSGLPISPSLPPDSGDDGGGDDSNFPSFEAPPPPPPPPPGFPAESSKGGVLAVSIWCHGSRLLWIVLLVILA